MEPRTLIESRDVADDGSVLERLSQLCALRGLDGLADHLIELSALVGDDMALLQDELAQVRRDERLSERAASSLLESSGKRLRPLCVALASRIGGSFGGAALDLAVAVELVHNATLLHDDVVDLAPTRRGSPSARAEFGNAASIFAGDWLLIEALRRVQRAGLPGLLDDLLDTIDEMIQGESLQLENRGALQIDRELYFRIAESKSATLFRWAMLAGGTAGGLPASQCLALGDYGTHLGVGFQVIDDLLDLLGDREMTGKALFADLREGKMTYPLIVALEREPGLRTVLVEIAAVDIGEEVPVVLRRRVRQKLRSSGAIEESRALARERIELARSSLVSLPPCPATQALAVVAESTLHRTL